MRPHTRLAAVAALLMIAVTALVDSASLVWALPVLPVLAWALTKIRWTDLARLRVVQGAAVGQVLAVVAAIAGAPVAVPAAAAGLVALAAAVTGYGLAKFPIRR